jgi:single-stranded-DNA-specific exonuclease
VLGSKARWKIGQAEEDLVVRLSTSLGLDPLIAKMLILRDIQTVEAAELFLNGGMEHFHDPFLLDGMRAAVERIAQAIRNQELIRIYGDYDADGVSSTALMVHLLRGLGARFDTYIPHRVREGYGLNRNAIDLAKDQGVSLLITVDTGISACDEIAYVSELGMEVIVTDHHEPPECLPDAFAVINPKKPDCPYPFKQLAGVGVALKLAHALLGRLPEELLEIAAIGTVADLMPLVDENRLIVKLGLARMQDSAYVGIKALLGVSGVERKEVTATHIGFSIAPRINASGRLESADDAVKLLITTDVQEAEQIAWELDALNKERQRIVEEITKEALVLAEEQCAQGMDKVIVVSKEDWNVGVIGIVASKIVDAFYRPVIVLSIDPLKGMAKGSARSIAGFDMYKALTACKEWMDHYGGHHSAAGMTLDRQYLDVMTRRLNGLAEEWLTAEDYMPMLRADVECRLSDVPISSIEMLQKLAPFGMGNPTPKFVFHDVQLTETRTMGKEKQHLKLVLSQTQNEVSCSVEAVAFSKGNLAELITPSARLDVVGEVSVNEWNGVRKPQIIMEDLRIPHIQLFDWRGTQRPETKVSSLLETLAVRADKSGRGAALVFFAESELAFFLSEYPSLDSCPIWTLNCTGDLMPGNATAQLAFFEQYSDIILYTAPRNVSHLEQVLKKATGLMRCYAIFAESGKESGGAVPSRDMFKLMYASIMQEGQWDLHNRNLILAFSKRSGLSETTIEFMIRVFEELEFIERSGSRIKLHKSPVKRDLSSSRLLQEREERQLVEPITVYSTAKELEQWITERLQQTNPILEEII